MKKLLLLTFFVFFLLGAGVVLNLDHFKFISTLSQASVDATVMGNNTIYVVPAGANLVIDKIVIRTISFTDGGKTTQAQITLGGISPFWTDYLSSATITVANNNSYQIAKKTDSAETPVYAGGTTLTMAIGVGSDATTEVWSVDVVGYLVE